MREYFDSVELGAPEHLRWANTRSYIGSIHRVKGTHLVLAFGALLYLSAIWFADPLLVSVVGVAVLVLLGIPATAISVIILLFAIGTGRSRQPPLLLLGATASLSLLVGLGIPLNRFVQQRAVEDAKAYPGRVAPLLKAYRQEHGMYPGSLNELQDAPRLPRLLRRWGYRSDGKTYGFTFAQPGGVIDSWEYNSESGTWNLST